jgi:hypothetical protein
MNHKKPLGSATSSKRKRTDAIEAGNFAFESIQGGLAGLKNEGAKKVHLLQIEASRKGYTHEIGMQVKDLLAAHLAPRPADAEDDTDEVLTSHRPLCCNTDDYLRLVHVPPRVNLSDECSYRDLEGVHVHSGACTSCAGHTHVVSECVVCFLYSSTCTHGVADKGLIKSLLHAAMLCFYLNQVQTQCECVQPRIDGKTNCPAGGAHDRAAKGDRGQKQGRVDHHDANGWRGAALPGCPSYMALMPTGDLLCPRWCITFKDGKGMARTACFGRLHPTEVRP